MSLPRKARSYHSESFSVYDPHSSLTHTAVVLAQFPRRTKDKGQGQSGHLTEIRALRREVSCAGLTWIKLGAHHEPQHGASVKYTYYHSVYILSLKIPWGQLWSCKERCKFTLQSLMEIYCMCNSLFRVLEHWTGIAIAPWLLNLKINKKIILIQTSLFNSVLNNFQLWHGRKNTKLWKPDLTL